MIIKKKLKQSLELFEINNLLLYIYYKIYYKFVIYNSTHNIEKNLYLILVANLVLKNFVLKKRIILVKINQYNEFIILAHIVFS